MKTTFNSIMEIDAYVDELRAKPYLTATERRYVDEWESYRPPGLRDWGVISEMSDIEQMELMSYLYNRFYGVTVQRVVAGRIIRDLKREVGGLKTELERAREIQRMCIFQQLPAEEQERVKIQAGGEHVDQLRTKVKKLERTEEAMAAALSKARKWRWWRWIGVVLGAYLAIAVVWCILVTF